MHPQAPAREAAEPESHCMRPSSVVSAPPPVDDLLEGSAEVVGNNHEHDEGEYPGQHETESRIEELGHGHGNHQAILRSVIVQLTNVCGQPYSSQIRWNVSKFGPAARQPRSPGTPEQ